MFEIIERQELVIWLYSIKQIKDLRKHGYIYYYSKRMKYAVMYVEKKDAERIRDIINSYFFVKDVSLSPRDEIDMSFSEALQGQEDTEFTRRFLGEADDASLLANIAQSIKAQRLQSK